MPITPRAIAAIALDHLPQNTSSREAMYTDRRDAPGTLGADLTYNATGEYDGDSLSVGLAPGQRDLDCEISHCADLDTDVENASMVLVWQELEPEEDPGIVTVLLYRDGEKAWVHQSWEEITGDPRDLDLQISVDDMVEVLEDPWLRLRDQPGSDRRRRAARGLGLNARGPGHLSLTGPSSYAVAHDGRHPTWTRPPGRPWPAPRA